MVKAGNEVRVLGIYFLLICFMLVSIQKCDLIIHFRWVKKQQRYDKSLMSGL